MNAMSVEDAVGTIDAALEQVRLYDLDIHPSVQQSTLAPATRTPTSTRVRMQWRRVLCLFLCAAAMHRL